MARLIFKSGATAATRRHGVVYATQPGVLDPITGITATNPTIRAGVIPLAPKTNGQAVSQVNISTVASLWAQMGPVEQLGWTDVGYLGNTPYANFAAWNMRNIQWKWPMTTVPEEVFTFAPTVLFSPVANFPIGLFTLNLYIDGSIGGASSANVHIYVQNSSALPVTYSGSSGNTPGRPGAIPFITPSGYTYHSSYTGLVPATKYTYFAPTDWWELMGTYPTPVTYNATTNQFNGSHLDVQYYVTNDLNQPFIIQAYGTTPPYEPYYSAGPQSASNGFALASTF
jgi:hypothetical protein